MTKPAKPYPKMTLAELRAATADLEAPDFEPKVDEQMPAERARMGRILTELKAKPRPRTGRPPVGKGAAKVMVALERALLKRADAFARRRKSSRSALIARGLRVLMGEETL